MTEETLLNWDNEFVKELLWILKQIEDVIDDQLNPEKRKSSLEKVQKKWQNYFKEEICLSLEKKLKDRKVSILDKILILVKKRLGYDISYSNSIFSTEISNQETKILFQNITDLCRNLQLPVQMSEYIHLVIFSMISLKYLSDLEYIYRVNRGTIFRDRGFKANKFSYLRFKLHRYILNFALMSLHPFMIRFNKLRTTMKNTIDTQFYNINLKIDDFIVETKKIWKRPSEDPNLLDPADQEELKIFYGECRVYLQEHCLLWLEKFKVGVRGELCPDEFEDEEEDDKKAPILTDAENVDTYNETEELVESNIPLVEDVIRLDGLDQQTNAGDTQTEETVERVYQPLFANFNEAELATRNWRIFQDPNLPVRRDLDVMSQTNSSKSEVPSDGLPSNSLEVASTSGSESTNTGSYNSYNSNDPLNPLARKRPKFE